MANDVKVVALAPNTWVDTTGEDVTEVTFQVRAGEVEILPASAASAPTATSAGYVFRNVNGQQKLTLADMRASITSGRLYARAGGAGGEIIVDNA